MWRQRQQFLATRALKAPQQCPAGTDPTTTTQRTGEARPHSGQTTDVRIGRRP